ncbi:hypothetical protein IscW_ISCW011196 [Ixodes scapularis]|uniref:Uncharacterized protein n=1 Tax=Ixodes scapularis TaxID=6945 RepID=B7Q4P1_IXOSC|nr:hypothetical protein IscW_ISCW011196 [Ixodes scapularis]|eukprot:XP_002411583.1 hypothetical protein IscW_ISCW011196 [Ixodes scapularis]
MVAPSILVGCGCFWRASRPFSHSSRRIFFCGADWFRLLKMSWILSDSKLVRVPESGCWDANIQKILGMGVALLADSFAIR